MNNEWKEIAHWFGLMAVLAIMGTPWQTFVVIAIFQYLWSILVAVWEDDSCK